MSTRDQRTSPAGRGGRRGLPRWAACAACALLLAGCQVLPERPALAATYDLGAGERGTLAHALAPRLRIDDPLEAREVIEQLGRGHLGIDAEVLREISKHGPHALAVAHMDGR